MKLLFTGATGVIGRHTIPTLVAAGHEVSAVARRQVDRQWLADRGARPVSLDLFEPVGLRRTMSGLDAVVHMATSIPRQAKMTKRRSWLANDRLRGPATGLLVDAAMAADIGLFVHQSVSLVYADGGDRWLTEESLVRPVWNVIDSALDGEGHADRFRRAGADAVTLRLSSLYGPGDASSEYLASVAARRLPIVGHGANYVSHLHVADAATAIEAALTAPSGTYNVSDDQPVSRRDELHALANAIGAPPPRSIPRWAARIAVGRAAHLLTVSHRVSNASFTRSTGWHPKFTSVAEGWSDTVGAAKDSAP